MEKGQKDILMGNLTKQFFKNGAFRNEVLKFPELTKQETGLLNGLKLAEREAKPIKIFENMKQPPGCPRTKFDLKLRSFINHSNGVSKPLFQQTDNKKAEEGIENPFFENEKLFLR